MRSAVAVLLLICFASISAAQDSTKIGYASLDRPYRDPHKARVFATILPGAGYAYTGEYLRGYGTWVVTAGGFILGPTMLSLDCYGFFSGPCGSSEHAANILIGSLLIANGVYAWISSVRDAPKSAERANGRHRRELSVQPMIGSPQSHRGLNTGLSVVW